jgi:hypothetical protein
MLPLLLVEVWMGGLHMQFQVSLQQCVLCLLICWLHVAGSPHSVY